MENNEQNNFEATNNVNPANNVEPTPTVEPTPEVKPEDTIMVAEPAARPAVEPVQAPVAPTVEEKKENTIMVAEPAARPAVPAPAPMAQPQEPVAQQPEVSVEPTVTAEPEPVVIPKGERPKKNNGLAALLLILILIVLAVCGYFVYDKYIKDLITKSNTNETSGNQANNVPEPTPDVDPTNDEGIFGELAVKNQKLEYEDSKGKSYTFDIYLDDKMVVEGLKYSEPGGNSGQISLNKIGYLKDTVTADRYFVFTVDGASVAQANTKLFIIDKDGKIVFQREGTFDGTHKIGETNEYVSGTTYTLDEAANKVFYYVISDSIEKKSIQISSGSPVDETYKTYAYDNSNNSNEVSPTEDGIYEKMPVGDASIGESITIKNIRYERKIIDTLPSDVHTFDLYLDDKLIVKDYEDILYTAEDIPEYTGTYINKIGNIKDTDIDASYIAFAVGSKLKITLYIIDNGGNIIYKTGGSKDANAEGFILKATNERFKTGDYKYINELDTNSNKNVDMILTYSGDYSTREGIVKSVKISSGVAAESVYKTYTSEEVSLTGR